MKWFMEESQMLPICAFGTLCHCWGGGVVEEASGYKYEGGYRVWNPKRWVVVESRDVTFSEDGLPPYGYIFGSVGT
jgi:hypothetical protein